MPCIRPCSVLVGVLEIREGNVSFVEMACNCLSFGFSASLSVFRLVCQSDSASVCLSVSRKAYHCSIRCILLVEFGIRRCDDSVVMFVSVFASARRPILLIDEWVGELSYTCRICHPMEADEKENDRKEEEVVVVVVVPSKWRHSFFCFLLYDGSLALFPYNDGITRLTCGVK